MSMGGLGSFAPRAQEELNKKKKALAKNTAIAEAVMEAMDKRHGKTLDQLIKEANDRK